MDNHFNHETITALTETILHAAGGVLIVYAVAWVVKQLLKLPLRLFE